MSEIKVGDEFQLEIIDIAHNGQGVGRFNSIVVFVPKTAVSDVVKIKITKVLKNSSVGEIKEIIKPALSRINSDCPYFDKCGGCDFRHISYDLNVENNENQIKEKLVQGNLERIGKVDIKIENPIISKNFLRYRNNVQMPIKEIDGKVRIGFFESGSHNLIPIRDCFLIPEIFVKIKNAFELFLNKYKISAYKISENHVKKFSVRHLYIRGNNDLSEIMVTVVGTSDSFKFETEVVNFFTDSFPEIKTIILNINNSKTSRVLGKEEKILFGEGYIYDEICGKKIRLSSRSFSQVNLEVANKLYKKALEYANPNPDDVLLDLYCGVGSIGLSMADKFKFVIGIDNVKDAIEDAVHNAEINKIDNAVFYVGNANKTYEKLKGTENSVPTIIIIDPPRKGLDSKTILDLGKFAPKRIVYISCNSATFSRDIDLLKKHDYTLKKASIANMFPRTVHVECIGVLEKNML